MERNLSANCEWNDGMSAENSESKSGGKKGQTP